MREKINIYEWYVQEGDFFVASHDSFTLKGAQAINERRKGVVEGSRVPIGDVVAFDILTNSKLTPEKKKKFIEALKNTPF